MPSATAFPYTAVHTPMSSLLLLIRLMPVSLYAVSHSIPIHCSIHRHPFPLLLIRYQDLARAPSAITSTRLLMHTEPSSHYCEYHGCIWADTVWSLRLELMLPSRGPVGEQVWLIPDTHIEYPHTHTHTHVLDSLHSSSLSSLLSSSISPT